MNEQDLVYLIGDLYVQKVVATTAAAQNKAAAEQADKKILSLEATISALEPEKTTAPKPKKSKKF